ncbi:Prephenate dehydratase-domain-containing protein [Spinellus fusiger]|nr:Prephenate dehydratase-domain-containing protein [Spinellus fusiger]
MSTSITVPEDRTIAFLGPRGTFSHQAAQNFYGNCHGEDVFEAVEKGEATYGIIPFENSIFGVVVETLDRFIKTTVKIQAETYLTVHQCLLSNSPLDKIKRVYSHPQGLGQTQKWLTANLPHADLISVNSTGDAAQQAALEMGAAAVCSDMCAELYSLKVVAHTIEDDIANTTRFLLIGTCGSQSTKSDHTLLQFTVDHQQPGALCDGLTIFKDLGLNLFKIDSRPSGLHPWHYVFFIECSGHHQDLSVQNAVDHLKRHCSDVMVLGSFPNQCTVNTVHS